jgi:hypothetical protein
MGKRSHKSSAKSKSTIKSTLPAAASATNAVKKGVAAVKRPLASKRLSSARSSSSVPETIDNFSDSPIDVDKDSIACANPDSEDADEEEVDPQKELGERDNDLTALPVLTMCRGTAEDLALVGLYVLQIRGPGPDP